MDKGFIGIVCGLKSEANAIGPIAHIGSVRVAISGADADRAREEALRLAESGAKALVSFGVSGGLTNRFRPGDLLVGEAVTHVPDGASWSLSTDLLETLRQTAREAHLILQNARLAGSDVLIDGPAVKQKLAEDYAVDAVDMESHAVATVAAEMGLACTAIRAIADPWDRAMPSSASGAVAEDGSIRTLRVLQAAAGRPKDWVGLMRLGRDSDAAHKALRRCAGHVFPALLRVMHIG